MVLLQCLLLLLVCNFAALTDLILLKLKDGIFSVSTCMVSCGLFYLMYYLYSGVCVQLPAFSVLHTALKWFALMHPLQFFMYAGTFLEDQQSHNICNFVFTWGLFLVLICSVTLWFSTCQHGLYLTFLCLFCV